MTGSLTTGWLRKKRIWLSSLLDSEMGTLAWMATRSTTPLTPVSKTGKPPPDTTFLPVGQVATCTWKLAVLAVPAARTIS